ncbi:MAG: dephospho-CoA kinase [Lachnospiraceae bacterium]
MKQNKMDAMDKAEDKRLKIIGITGGVGSGKSRVLTYLKYQYQAKTYQADEIACYLQQAGTPCFDNIVAHFGTQILSNDGQLNREQLAEIVFQDETQLLALNQIVHPAVKNYVRQQIEFEKNKGTQLFVLEAALLIEGHYEEICDELWYVYVSEEIRKRRLREQRGYTIKKIEQIVAVQASEYIFRQRCQRVIDNNGTFQSTCEQIAKILEK